MESCPLVRPPSVLARAAAALGLLAAVTAMLAAPAPARADVEARCPPGGYATLSPPPGAGGERPVVVCVRPPVQIAASELANRIAPGSPEESRIASGLAQQMSEAGSVTAGPFHNETIAGHAARVSEVSGTGTAEGGGAPTRIEGSLILLPVGSGTVIVMGLTQDAARGNARQAVRAFVPTIAGLDGSPAPSRVNASCPAGLSPTQAGPVGPGGMRRAVLCSDGEGGRRVDVLESRLPVRTAAEARPHAEAMATAIGRQLQALGGSASAGPTETVTFGPGLSGFVTPVHGQASDPRAPQGAPGAGITFEGLVAVLPTSTGGHAQVTVTSQNEPADAVRARLRAFVTGNLRLDGSGAPGASVAEDGGAAGGAGATSSSAPPTPRRREIDPTLPLWTPDDESGGRPGRDGGTGPEAASQPPASESESARTGRYATYGFVAVVVLLLVYLFRRR